MSDNFAKALSNGFADVESVREEKSFAELVESYDEGMGEDVQIGDQIKGEIISIGSDAVFVNTGTKIDGTVEKAELLDDNGELPYEKGDVLELYVVAKNENEIRLSKALSGVGGLNLIKDAFQNRIPAEGKVIAQCKGGFHVEIIQRKAFCPVSQMDFKPAENLEDYVGNTYLFQITQFEENGKNIVVSRRELLAKEHEEEKKKFTDELSVGTVLKGKVKNRMPYGAFIELFPGVEGMIHISELSWSKSEKIEDILKTNDEVTVKIISIEPDKKSGLKIALSMKQMTEDPWERDIDKFHVGDRVRGKVTQCMAFGAFVEIAPGIEGLVHISEMSYKRRVLRPDDVVQIGDTVDVMIKEIATDKRRISLSIKDAKGDPWINIQEKYSVGQAAEGTLEKKEKFGYFIKLEPGITGLLPKSKISKASQPAQIERLKEGEKISVTIDEIRPRDRKISLGPGDVKEEEEDNWQKYTREKKVSMGSLGEKLQQALNAKNEK